jgi:hypothetical protein
MLIVFCVGESKERCQTILVIIGHNYTPLFVVYGNCAV